MKYLSAVLTFLFIGLLSEAKQASSARKGNDRDHLEDGEHQEVKLEPSILKALEDFADHKVLSDDDDKKDRHLLETIKSILDARNDDGKKASAGDVDTPLENGKALRGSIAKQESKPSKDLPTSFLTDIVFSSKLKSLLNDEISPVSLFPDGMGAHDFGLVEETVESSQGTKTSNESDGGRQLQASPECRAVDGSVICIALNSPFQGLFIVFYNCPVGLTSLKQCKDCEILQVDSTPDDLSDNPRCLCDVCSATESAVVEHDCSGIGSGNCVHRSCAGQCASTPPNGMLPTSTSNNVLPSTSTPPTGMLPTSTSNNILPISTSNNVLPISTADPFTSALPATSVGPSTIALPATTAGPSLPTDCIQTAQGNIGCFLVNEPATNFVTLFTQCPRPPLLTGPRDCTKCVVIGPDGTPDDVTDNPTCAGCSVCPTGQLPFAHSCPSLLAGTSCPNSDCDGCITGTPPTPTAPPTLPADCSVTSQGTRYCYFADDRTPGDGYITLFTGCPVGFTGPQDCLACQVIAPDATPGSLADNDTCMSCSVCSQGTVKYSYDCSDLSTPPACPEADCNGSCLSTATTASPGSGGSTGTCISRGNLCYHVIPCCPGYTCTSTYAGGTFYNLCS